MGAAEKVIEYVIAAKDKTASAVRSALSRIRSFATSVGSHLMNIKAGFDMAKGVVQTFADVFATAIREAFRFEKATADFKVLLGSIDAAKAHIEDLRRFASSTPLTFGDLSKASKLLLSFGTSVEDVMPAMKMLGDIAMGDSQKFQGLALVFAQVKSAGKLMGQDLLQMINQGFNPLTVISQQTGRSVSDLKDMMAEGAISFEMVAEAMRVATSEGGLFANAMKESSKTGEGLVSTLQDKWTDAVREFGNAFQETAKGDIQTMIDKLTELVESGTVEDWADTVAKKLSQVADSFSLLGKAASAIWRYSGASDLWHGANSFVQGVGSAAGTAIGGGSWSDIADSYEQAATEEMAKGQYTRMLMENGNLYGKFVDMELDALHAKDEGRAARRGRKKEQPKTDNPPRTDAPSKGLSEMLAEAEAGNAAKEEARLAKEREKALAEEERIAKELAKEEERMRVEAERAIAAERDRLQRRTLDEYRKGLEAAQSASSDAQARLAAAQANERQAWGWYRNRDSWKAQIEGERADAKAQVQFEKDLDRLKYRRDWRTATLSDDDEVVRRVAFAREEKAAAEGYARQTAECAARAAEALERIQDEMEGT